MPLYPPAGGGGGAAISAGANSQNTGTVVFSNSNGVSFGMNGAGVITATVVPGAAAGIAAFGAGTQTATSGTIVFANSNGITAGMSGSTQVTFDFGSSSLAGTGFTTTTVAGAVIAGTHATNGLLLAVPGYLTTAQPPGAYLTTARASNDAIGLNTALTANGVSVTANSSGLSLNFPAFLTTAALSNHSHGNPTLNLTNLSGTTASNSAGFTLSLSANGAAAGVGIEAGTRTATTAGNIRFETGNGITFGLNGVGGSVMTASHNGLTTARASNDAIGLNTAITQNGVSMTANSSGLSLNFPAFLTTAALSNHSHGNPTLNLTNLAGTTASNSAGFTLSLSATAQSTQSAIRGFGVSNTGVTAGNTGISTGIDWVLAGSQSLTLSQSTAVGGPNTIWIQHPAWLTTARASTDGVGLNTALTAGPLAWTVNSGGISLNAGSAAGTTSGFAGTNISGSITHNTAGINIALSVAAPGGGGTITMYATSNTTQSSTGTANVNSLIFAGAGIASVGITNGSVLISVPAGGGAGDGVNIISMATSTSGGGTEGTTYSNSTGTVGLVAGSNITLGQSNDSIIIRAPNSSSIVGISGISISTNGSTISLMETPQLSLVCPDMALSVIGALGNGSFSIAYRDVNVPVSATRVDMPFFWSQASSAAANTVAIAMTVLCGIYTRNASTLNTVSSASTQTTYTLASNTAGITAFSVARNLPISIPMNVNMSRGQYYMGFGISTTFSSIGTATTTAAQTISAIGVPQGSSAVPWVDNITRASATSVGMFSGHGIYSAAVATVPTAISLSAINQSGSYFHRANIALVFRG